MKTAYIAYGRFPTERAHGIQIGKVCEALGVLCDTTLVVPDFEVARGLDAFEFYSIRKTFRILKLPASFSTNRFLYSLDRVRFLWQAASFVRSQHIDSVITREPLLLLFLSKKVTLEIHDFTRTKGIHAFFWRRASRIIAKTYALKRILIAYGVKESRILVLPNAVDVAVFDVKVDAANVRSEFGIPAGPIALYSGSLQAWKGVETLVRAAALLPEVQIVIVGGTKPEIEQLRATINTSNLHYLGQLPHNRIPELLSIADVLVLPNSKRSETSTQYTSPLKLFEYMAARRPVVASRIDSIREVVTDKEVVFFEPDDSDSLARAIKEIIFADPQRINSLSSTAYERIKQNTWDSYADRLVDVETFAGSTLCSGI